MSQENASRTTFTLTRSRGYADLLQQNRDAFYAKRQHARRDLTGNFNQQTYHFIPLENSRPEIKLGNKNAH